MGDGGEQRRAQPVGLLQQRRPRGGLRQRRAVQRRRRLVGEGAQQRLLLSAKVVLAEPYAQHADRFGLDAERQQQGAGQPFDPMELAVVEFRPRPRQARRRYRLVAIDRRRAGAGVSHGDEPAALVPEQGAGLHRKVAHHPTTDRRRDRRQRPVAGSAVQREQHLRIVGTVPRLVCGLAPLRQQRRGDRRHDQKERQRQRVRRLLHAEAVERRHEEVVEGEIAQQRGIQPGDPAPGGGAGHREQEQHQGDIDQAEVQPQRPQ